MRLLNRKNNQLRPVSMEINYLKHAEGSCFIKCGNTHVICSASLEENVPRFLKGKNSGWVTAEYGMLPRSTNLRNRREASNAGQSGRTLEIQRLIARSMRSAIDLKKLGPRQIILDCDVINADGGTRTAAITGSYVALHLAVRSLLNKKLLKDNPLITQIAAISSGIYKGEIIIDLDYNEDSNADLDMNLVFNEKGNLIEIQGTGEKSDFSTDKLTEILKLASKSVNELFTIQNQILFPKPSA